MTGEGIFYALDSGKLAAQHLGRMFASGDFSRQSLQGYDRHLRLRYQLFISLYANVRSLSLPFSSHRFIYTHGMNCAIESLHLAFRLPGAKRLFLYATGAAPHRYPLSLEALVRSTG